MTVPLTNLISRVTGLPRNEIHVSLRRPLAHQSNRLYDAWAGSRHLIAKANQLAGWEVNSMGADERLRRYLARGLAWSEADYREVLADLAEVTFFPQW